ncbi:nitroreductase family protein [Streptomyces sp. NPDC058375]|uniref:nitroreductase family protein n=1 Tax=Streptomyces sp. NPDC058375 TaxID=3346467 RepID=UPI00365EAC00
MPALGLTADEVLTTPRAVRKRLDLNRPVERELIEGCLRLATRAPTGRNRQRWDVVLVTDPGKRAAPADLYRLGLARPRQQVVRDGVNRGDAERGRRIADSAQYLYDHLHGICTTLCMRCRCWSSRASGSRAGARTARTSGRYRSRSPRRCRTRTAPAVRVRAPSSDNPAALTACSRSGAASGVHTTTGVPGWPSRTVSRNPQTAGPQVRAVNAPRR